MCAGGQSSQPVEVIKVNHSAGTLPPQKYLYIFYVALIPHEVYKFHTHRATE